MNTTITSLDVSNNALSDDGACLFNEAVNVRALIKPSQLSCQKKRVLAQINVVLLDYRGPGQLAMYRQRRLNRNDFVLSEDYARVQVKKLFSKMLVFFMLVLCRRKRGSSVKDCKCSPGKRKPEF